jgi:hypothetical protein
MTSKLDFLHGVQNAIDSFLSASTKLLNQDLPFPEKFVYEIDSGYNNYTYTTSILFDLCEVIKNTFCEEKNKYISKYNKQFHIKPDKLCAQNILIVLQSIINNKKLYDEEYIAPIEKDYYILQEYELYCEMFNDYGYDDYSYIKEKINCSELDVIHETNKKRVNDIYININKIYILRKQLQDVNNNVKNIALEIKGLVNTIFVNYKGICNFSKEFAWMIADMIHRTLYNELRTKTSYLGYITHNNINEHKQILANAFEKIMDFNYRETINIMNILYKHAIALSDKLEVICSIYE